MLGQWLNGTVLDVDNGGRVLIHWAGCTRYFDVWLDALEVRKPEGERPLDRRRPVLKSNFPTVVVTKNGCFRGKVRH